MLKKLFLPGIMLMDKLNFKIKIVVTISVLFVLLVAPSSTTFTTYMNKKNSCAKQEIGLTYLSNIKHIIQDVQNHRGYLNTFLNGKKSFKNKVKLSEQAINNNINNLVAFDQANLNVLKTDEDFVQALSYYMIIKSSTQTTQKNSKINTKELFELHTKMISRLLKSIKKITKSTLFFDTQDDAQINYIAQLLQDKLLILQENTAQLRGMVAGVLAKHKITPKQINTIMLKYTYLKSSRNNLLNTLVINKVDNYMQVQNAISVAKYELDEVLKVVYRNILINQNLSYDSALFFKKSDSALQAQSKVYNSLMDIFKNHIEKTKKQSTQTLIYSLIKYLVIFAGAFYLASSFYYSIVKSLKELQRASDEIASGRTNVRLNVNTQDELGRAILSFNSMGKKLNKSLSFLDSYKMAIDETSIVSKTNKKGIITYVNKKFCEISGYNETELLGMPHNIIRHPEMPKEAFRDMWATIKSKKIWKGIVKNKTKSGGYYIVDATIIPILNEKDEIVEYIAVRHDVTELERSKEKIKKQKIDLLTGLPNQNKLIQDIKGVSKPVLLYININNFSDVNDFYGKKIADEVLIKLANFLQEVFKDKCKIYKNYNDEFFLLFQEDILDINQSEQLMKHIVDLIESKNIQLADNSIPITIRGGIAHYLQSTKHETLLSLAMMASKEAKLTNKKFLMYDKKMNKESDYKNNIEWIKKIKEAIAEDRIVPFFQPLVDSRSGAVTKFESLVRLIEKNGKVVSPFYFLDIAKKAKLYTTITKIMMEKTLKQLEQLPQYDYSINLTVEDIMDKDIQSFIINKIRSCRYANHIVLEITESEKIQDYELIDRFITEVKQYGVKIAIDDFGSGYANFDHIVGLNVDFIKVDGSLIKDIDTNKEAMIITEAIIAFSKKLGCKTVVEYVHSKEVLQKVVSLGADYLQGYYLGKPTHNINSIYNITKTNQDQKQCEMV